MKKNIIILILILMTFSLTGCSDNYFLQNQPLDTNGNLEVSIQDQFTEIIDLKLSQKIANINITLNTSIGDTFVNISSDTVPVIDDLVCFKENKSFFQSNILTVTSLGGSNYQLELEKPLDFAFTTNGGCSVRNDNWAIDGSITTQTFSVSPANLNNVSWDITRVIFGCIGTGVGVSNDKPDLGDFFVTTSITNGIVFRMVDGVTKNIFSATDNFHLALEAYDVNIFEKSKTGFYSVITRRSFNGADKNGVTIRLNSETSDTFELLIRDDLSDMEECHAIAQGHRVE